MLTSKKNPKKGVVVAAGNLRTEAQTMMFRKLTKKTLVDEKEDSSEDDADINSKKKTVR